MKHDPVLDIAPHPGHERGDFVAQVEFGDHEQIGLLHGNLKPDLALPGVHSGPVAPGCGKMTVRHYRALPEDVPKTEQDRNILSNIFSTPGGLEQQVTNIIHTPPPRPAQAKAKGKVNTDT